MIVDATTDGTGARKYPWGWLVIIALAVACCVIGLHTLHKKDTLDGRWAGRIQIDSVHAQQEFHRTGSVSIPLKTTDSFMDQHGGTGTLTFPGDPKVYTFELDEVEPELDRRNPNTPRLQTHTGDYVLSGQGSIAWSPTPDAGALDDASAHYWGTFGSNKLQLHTEGCPDVSDADCSRQKYRIELDFELASSDQRRASVEGLCGPFLYFLPMFLVFYKQRFKPWSGVWFVIVFTAIAAFTFGISWVIALASIFLPSGSVAKRVGFRMQGK